MRRISWAIIFRLNSKTPWQMFLLLYGPHVAQTWALHTKLYKFGQITCEWKAAESWFLARLFIYQSSIVSQILDFIHWMVTILVLITWLVKTENSAFKTLPFPNETCSFHRINLKKNKLQIFTMLNILRRLWWYTWRLTIDDWLSPAGEEVYTKEKPYAEVFQG